MFEVFCEWDIGQHGLVFKTDHAAERWLRANPVLRDLSKENETPFDEYYQELCEECLIGIDSLTLIE